MNSLEVTLFSNELFDHICLHSNDFKYSNLVILFNHLFAHS